MEGWRVRENCGVCRGFVNGAECQNTIDNEDPRMTAGQLCVMGLVQKIERNREQNYTGNMSHVWECLEASLAASEPYPKFADTQINEAFDTINDIILDKSRNIVETCEAVSLKNYEPMFRARVALQPITEEMMLQVRDDVGALIGAIDKAEDVPANYDGFMSGFMAEEIVSWLILHGGNPDETIYPSSHREGRSDMKRYNHDRYQLRDGYKVPVEIKRRHRNRRPSRKRTYDKPITVVVLQDVLEETRSKHGKIRSNRDNFLIDYIRYSMSDRSSGPKDKVLRTASDIVLNKIEQNLENIA